MVFRSDGMSEDCLYLNVWAPASRASGVSGLPVLVYFYGGGFNAGDGSEPRYEGESMATRGIISLTVNYRLGVFGLLAYPGASGNYGLMDQAAALQWVHENIAAFGGDPARVTIAGESAGSMSVSALMASPLSRSLIAGAIGESGSVMGFEPPMPLAKAEENGVAFAKAVGAGSLAELRAMPADKLLAAAHDFHFSVITDGYFFPRVPVDIFRSGEQAHVPLLVGWNSGEGGARSITEQPTIAGYEAGVRKLYGDQAGEVLKLYHAGSDAEVEAAATALAGDKFIGFSTWRWAHLQAKTGGKPVYRYFYEQPRPGSKWASHSAEIEYAMGNLDGNKVFAWTADDRAVSATMQGYFVNFIKTGDPNGPGLPRWPAVNGSGGVEVQHIGVRTRTEPALHEDRYECWDNNSK
jgi:para-nitrobenzyl esterase